MNNHSFSAQRKLPKGLIGNPVLNWPDAYHSRIHKHPDIYYIFYIIYLIYQNKHTVFIRCILLWLFYELLVDWHHQFTHVFQAHFTWQSSIPMKYILSILSIWLPNLTYLSLACITLEIYDYVLNTQHVYCTIATWPKTKQWLMIRVY